MKNIVLGLVGVVMVAGAAVAGSAQIGYGSGQVDREIAEAVVTSGNGVIVDNVLYPVGYGEGRVDPRLARALN